MYCESCGKELKSQLGRYHYQESGLDYIWLEGIEIYECGNKGCEIYQQELGAIPKVEMLHSLIVKALIRYIFPFTGKESRFLRTYFGLKSKEWAEYLKVSAETVSRWEKLVESIGQQSDHLMRLLALRLLEEKEQSWISEVKSQQIVAANKRPAHHPLLISHIEGIFHLVQTQ